jgi:hypothetical protein
MARNSIRTSAAPAKVFAVLDDSTKIVERESPTHLVLEVRFRPTRNALSLQRLRHEVERRAHEVAVG